jgi:uncharacterized membrane-anchored protein
MRLRRKESGGKNKVLRASRSFVGRAKIDKRTKNLVNRLSKDDIAVIDHKDIDRVSAENLISCSPLVIIDTQPMISGRYPTLGPSLLSDAGIYLIDCVGEDFLDKVGEGQELSVVGSAVYKNGELIAEGRELTGTIINHELKKANLSLGSELEKFASNTLDFIKNEKSHVFDELNVPHCSVKISGRHALIVIRGHDYREDMKALKFYIRETKPVLIAVDGGADLLLEEGYRPDVIIGDMDSVSDQALESAKEIVVHAYHNGDAPGGDRLDDLGIEYKLFNAKATSEDLAMLYAYEHGAEMITAVGTHSNLVDFLDKGREGMASTFLTRLKVGSRLVDARGVYKLHRSTVKTSYLLMLVLAALLTVTIIIIVSAPIREMLQLMFWRLSLRLGI